MDMVSVEEYFGARAGVIWAYLKENGPSSITQIKRKTKLKDTELYSGLGWLGREGKIEIHGEIPLLYRFALKE